MQLAIPESKFQKKLARWSVYPATLVIIIASGVLIGWGFDVEILKRPVPHPVAMNPVSAVAFIFSASAFLFFRAGRNFGLKQLIGSILAILVLLIGVLKFTGIALGFATYIDTLLFSHKLQEDVAGNISNQMALNTAAGFILTGSALLLQKIGSPRYQKLTHALVLVIALLGLLSLLGYLYRVQAFYGVLRYVPMAVYTAICFLFLSVAILLRNPAAGIMKDFTSQLAGSVTARILVPTTIIVPIVLGFFRLIGHWTGIFTTEFGVTILVLSIIVVFLGIIWYNAVLLNKKDLLKREAENALRQSEEQIQAIFNAAPDAVIVIDNTGKIMKWNPMSETMFGWAADEVLDKPLSEIIIPPRYREAHENGLKHFLKTGEGPVLGKTIEIQAINKNNIEFDVALSISPTTVNDKYLFIGFIRDITERKKSEEKLEASQKIFSTVFFKSPVMNSITDALTGKFIEVNDNLVEFCGLTKEQIIGKSSLELNLIPDPEQRKEIINTVKEKGFKRDVVMQVRAGNGDTKWVSTSAHAVAINGKDCFLTAMIDVTARKLAEEKLLKLSQELEQKVIERTNELAKSEKLFRAMIEKDADMKTLATPDGKVFYASPSLTTILGYENHEIMTIPAFELIHPDDIPGLMEGVTDIIQMPGKSFYRQQRLKHKNGTWIYCEGTITNMLHEPGVAGLVSNFRDITERKQTEEALLENQQLLSAIVNNSVAVIYVKDLPGRYLLVNHRFCELFHLSEEAILGKTDHDLFPKEQADTFRQMDVRTAAAVHALTEEEGVPQDDGLHTYISVKSVLKNASGQSYAIFGISTDITDRKKAQLEVQKLNEELEQKVINRTAELRSANKELESFTYSVSHDLRAPLRIIDGYSDILVTDYENKLDGEANRLLGIIKSNARRMGQLIDDLLNLSQTGRKELVMHLTDMNNLVKAVIDEQLFLTGNIATIKMGKLEPAECDSSLLRQVWINLISNALKYSGKQEKPEIQISSVHNGNEVIYSVKDNGVGFDMQYAGKLFGVFQRLHGIKEFEGTGIGLALANRILIRHKGKIWAEAEPGKGAIFYFSLPA